EGSDFQNRTTTTDSSGAWQLKAVPPELMSHIGFQLTHPDYLSTNMTFHGDDETEKQLRAGTFKVVLRSGISVTGRVLDETDNPITNATVTTGMLFSSDRQKEATDSLGKFQFRTLQEGDVAFGVLADGYAPETKTINVHSGMDEIVLRLKPGHSIRGI